MTPLVVADDAVVVADRAAAGKILCSPSKRAGFAHLVSIGAPFEPPPAGLASIGHRLRLVFEDSLRAEDGGPAREDIERLVAFAGRVDLSRGRLLVQCQAGISRSSAAAIVALAAILGPGREAEAVLHVLRTHPQSRPNRRMLELADAVLNAEGRLVAAGSEARGR